MKVYTFQCKLLSEVILTSSSATEGNQDCLDYIPGAKFMGLAAKSLYGEDASDTLDIFHNGTVAFGDASPLLDNEPTFSFPYSWYHAKLDDIERGIFLHHELSAEQRDDLVKQGKQLKQKRNGYFSRSGRYYNPAVTFALKSSYDREKRRALDGNLFGYSALQANSRWQFEVCDSSGTYLEKIRTALEGVHGVGRSRSAEYGLVEITFVGEGSLPQPDSQPEAYALVYAQSNLCFYDDVGLSTTQPTAKKLGFGDGASVNWARSQVRTRVYQSWNRKRYNRNPDRRIVEKGSVFFIDLESHSQDAKWPAFLGAHRSEGFGKVLYNPWFLFSSELGKVKFTRWTPKGENLPEKGYPEVDPSSNAALLSFLKRRIASDSHDIRVDDEIQRFIEEKASHFEKISPSQWGTIRSYAKFAANEDNLKKLLFDKEIGCLYRGKTESDWRKGNRRDKLEAFLFGSEATKGANKIQLCIKLASEMAKKSKART